MSTLAKPPPPISHPLVGCCEESILLLLHEDEGGGHVVILHRADVVVQQRQRVARLDEEVVVDAPVAVVMDGGREIAAEQLAHQHDVSLQWTHTQMPHWECAGVCIQVRYAPSDMPGPKASHPSCCMAILPHVNREGQREGR